MELFKDKLKARGRMSFSFEASRKYNKVFKDIAKHLNFYQKHSETKPCKSKAILFLLSLGLESYYKGMGDSDVKNKVLAKLRNK